MMVSELVYPKKMLKTAKGTVSPNGEAPYWLNITDQLEKRGFVKDGNGKNSSIFSHPRLNYVLKLFDAKDAPYLSFYKLATTYSNPHFPQFRGKLMKISDDVYAVRMETLLRYPTQGMTKPKILKAIKLRIETGWTLDEWITNQFPDLEEACALLQENTTDHDFDIEGRNLMFRDYVPVIIDPWKEL